MDNKTFKTMALTALALMAFCGTTYAAPRHGNGGGRAPAARQHHAQPTRHAQPAHHAHHAPAHYAHPAPPPPAPPPPRQTVVVHEETGLFTTGACVLGALVGGLLGAAF